MADLLIEAQVPPAQLRRQALTLTVALTFFVWILADGLAYGPYARAISVPLTILSAILTYRYLAWRGRFGSFIKVYEDHIECADRSEPRSLSYPEISKLVNGENNVFFVLYTGERVRAPRGRIFEDAYQLLCERIPNNFGDPPYFGGRIRIAG